MSERRGRPPARFSPSLSDQTGERRSEGLKDRRKGDGQRSSERLSVQRSGKSKNEAQGSVEIDVVNLGPEEAAFVPRPPQSIGRKRKRQEQTAPAISPQPTPTDEECIDVAGTSLEEEQEDHDSSAENPPQLAPAEAIEKSAAYDALRSILPGPTPSGIAAIHLLLESTQPEQTDYGDYYLTVIPRRLTEFYRKESVLNIVANYALETRELGWVNRTAPIIPPFSGEPGNYLFLVDGSKLPPSVLRQDALSPWSRNKDEIVNGVPKPHTRCKQRHFPVVMETGRYQIAAGERAQEAIYRLHEYTATHPHCARLKKRIYYLERDGTVFGNYMVLYEFTGTGGYPKLTKKMEHMLEMLRKGDELPLLACIPGQETRFAQMDTSEQLDIEEMIEVDGDIEGEERCDTSAEYYICEHSVTRFKYPRLRRKIFFVVTRDEQLIANVIILYLYAEKGALPALPSGSTLANVEFVQISEETPIYDLLDVVDTIQLMPNALFARVLDTRLLHDKRRILELAFNQAATVSELGLLNDKVPGMPPQTQMTGCFVCFVDTKSGALVDQRQLTIDALAPWSEGQRGAAIFIRPKYKRYQLYRSNENARRLELCWNAGEAAVEDNASEFSLVVYTATLPRCQRLKKRIYYVMCGRCLVGNVVIFYNYEIPGPLPTEVAPLNLVNAEVQKRVNAVLDFAAFQFNCGSEKEVLDVLFRVLVQRNETHLLQNVRDEYGIEILTQEEPLDVSGENPK
ncbi:unnamed protein product, partial [Mesorhabditis spiculigera]